MTTSIPVQTPGNLKKILFLYEQKKLILQKQYTTET